MSAKLKGLILSGGKGTRLRPITHTSAKQLVPVANKPILFYGIEALKAAGIAEIGIIVGETKKEITDAVGDGSSFGVNVTYIEQAEPLGLAHAVLCAEEYLDRTPFVMYLGDNLILSGIAGFVEKFVKNQPNSQILLAHVPNPEQFGVAELDGERVLRLVEKPKEPKSDLALVGVYMFDHNVFEAARSIKPSFRGELEITDAIQWLIDHGRVVEYEIITGWWKDTGKLEDLLEANRMVLDTFDTRIEGEVDEESSVTFKVVVETGARIVNSTIRGPAIIGKGAEIVNSYIGPFTSVYHDSKIISCEIDHSVVLENSRLEDIRTRVTDSLIGKNVEVMKHPRLPKAYRFMLGDSSKVWIL